MSEIDQFFRMPDSPARGTVGAGGVVPSIRSRRGISALDRVAITVAGIAPAQPPLPACMYLPFQLAAGSQTSSLISESATGRAMALRCSGRVHRSEVICGSGRKRSRGKQDRGRDFRTRQLQADQLLAGLLRAKSLRKGKRAQQAKTVNIRIAPTLSILEKSPSSRCMLVAWRVFASYRCYAIKL